MVILHFSGS